MLDARKYWSSLGIKLAWFTLLLLCLTLAAIGTFAADFIRILLSMAQVAQAIGSFVDLFVSGWSEPDDDEDSEDAGWCERHVPELLGKREKLGDALMTLSDAMVGAERCFQLRLLDCRRMVRLVQWALDRTEPLRKALVEKGSLVDSGLLAWPDVEEVLENYLEDSNFEFEAQAVSFLKQHGELAALTMALLAKEVQVEERCFNLDGNLTLRGAEQAITRAVHQTVDTAKTVQSVVGKYVAPDSSEHLAGAIQSIKQMLGSSIMQSVQIQLEQVGVSPMVFQTLRTVGAAIPSDHSSMLDLLTHVVEAVATETSIPIATLAACALKGGATHSNLDVEVHAALSWVIDHAECSARMRELLQPIVDQVHAGQSRSQLIKLLEQAVATELGAAAEVTEDTNMGSIQTQRLVQAILAAVQPVHSGGPIDKLNFCSTVMEALAPFLPTNSWVDVVKQYDFPEASQGLLTELVEQVDQGNIVVSLARCFV